MVGATGFSIGFFGPMILAPGANQGPLLGILITGPLGALLGLVIGVVQEVVGVRGSPADLLARRGLLSDGGRRVWRAVAALVAIVFLAGAAAGLWRGEPVGAVVRGVVGVALAWFAVNTRTGRGRIE